MREGEGKTEMVVVVESGVGGRGEESVGKCKRVASFWVRKEFLLYFFFIWIQIRISYTVLVAPFP